MARRKRKTPRASTRIPSTACQALADKSRRLGGEAGRGAGAQDGARFPAAPRSAALATAARANASSAVKALAISPFLIDFTGNCFRVLVLSPGALRDRPELAREWHAYRRPVLTVATLGPLGYLLVLFAMRRAPISHVAPTRELATLVGTWFGARLLGEQAAAQRLAGALCIVAGVIALALSG